MDILVNLINLLTDRINDISDKNIINIVLSKLDFIPNHYKVIKNDSKIFIKCHNYYINVFNDDDYNKDEIKIKAIEYSQSLIYSHTENSCIPPPQHYNEIINNIDSYKSRNPNLYICIIYADIIIDLETQNYKITKSYFNIRKPTEDKYKLFETIITNIDNPSYYFNLNYDLKSINEVYSNIDNNIYHLTDIKLSFIGKNGEENKIGLIMPTISSISPEIDTKPLLSNQIKTNIIKGGFI
jgi:hypothetical protein